MASLDIDSAGVYFITREAFEARSEAPVAPRDPAQAGDERESADPPAGGPDQESA